MSNNLFGLNDTVLYQEARAFIEMIDTTEPRYLIVYEAELGQERKWVYTDWLTPVVEPIGDTVSMAEYRAVRDSEARLLAAVKHLRAKYNDYGHRNDGQ